MAYAIPSLNFKGNNEDNIKEEIIEPIEIMFVEKEQPKEIEYNGPYYIKVNRKANVVTVYGQDENGDFTIPIKAMTCSVGTKNRTPLGITQTTNKNNFFNVKTSSVEIV